MKNIFFIAVRPPLDAHRASPRYFCGFGRHEDSQNGSKIDDYAQKVRQSEHSFLIVYIYLGFFRFLTCAVRIEKAYTFTGEHQCSLLSDKLEVTL
jgi:hypothetical protein